MLSSVKDGPGDFSRIFLVFQQGLGFTVDEDDFFTVGSDVGFTVAGVNGQTGEMANFGSHFMEKQLKIWVDKFLEQFWYF